MHACAEMAVQSDLKKDPTINLGGGPSSGAMANNMVSHLAILIACA